MILRHVWWFVNLYENDELVLWKRVWPEDWRIHVIQNMPISSYWYVLVLERTLDKTQWDTYGCVRKCDVSGVDGRIDIFISVKETKDSHFYRKYLPFSLSLSLTSSIMLLLTQPIEKYETEWLVMVKNVSIDANKLMKRQKGFPGLPLHARHTKKTL